jgi:hypothetical protein
MKHAFRFLIRKPYHLPNRDEEKLVMVEMTAPCYVFPVRLKSDVPFEVQMRLAKAETKMEMIEALLRGKWELEK